MPPKFLAVFSNREKTRRYSLQPANQPLDDVPPAVQFPVELHTPPGADFVVLGRDDWRDSQIQQVLIDPFRAVPLVSGQRDGSGRRFPRSIRQPVGRHQDGVDDGRIMGLSAGQLETEGKAVSICEKMDFRGETSAGTSQRMVLRFFRIPFLPPPAAQRWARITVPSMHHNSSDKPPPSTIMRVNRSTAF
jgi:hypothetical protein